MKVGFPGGLYWTENTADDVGVPSVYSAMAKISNVTAAKITFKVDDVPVNAEDLTQEIIRYISGAEVEFNAKDLALATRAAHLNHAITGGIVAIGANDIPKWIGFAFKIKRIEGGVTHYQYIRLLKGYMQLADIEAQTREDKLNPKEDTIKYVFVPRKYDEKVVEMTDSALPTYNPADASSWFTTFGTSDTTPPTLSSTTPAANATTVPVGSTFQWTFSEAIMPACVNSANFAVVKDSDGSNVAGTLSQSGDKKTVTFTPQANLTAATVYRAIATPGVKDLAGNALAAISVNKFTTA